MRFRRVVKLIEVVDYLFYINNSEIIEMKSKMALGSQSKTSLKQGRMICVLREG